MRRAAVALGVLLVLVAVRPAEAIISTQVTMVDNAYQPKVAKIVPSGNEVQWHNSGSVAHGVKTDDGQPGSLTINSVAPGGTSSATTFFDSVGSWKYHDPLHPTMRGVIGTRVQPDFITQSLGSVFNLTWASAPGGANISFDIQVKDPGSDRYVTLVRDTTNNTGTFKPNRKGKYRLRGRTQRDGTHETTGYSPSIAINVT